MGRSAHGNTNTTEGVLGRPAACSLNKSGLLRSWRSGSTAERHPSGCAWRQSATDGSPALASGERHGASESERHRRRLLQPWIGPNGPGAGGLHGRGVREDTRRGASMAPIARSWWVRKAPPSATGSPARTGGTTYREAHTMAITVVVT